jgi:hypothetical protein
MDTNSGISSAISANSEPRVTETEELISVRVGQLPGKIKPIKIAGAGCTVSKLLVAAEFAKNEVEAKELTKQGWEIRVDNAASNMETPVRHNQTVLLIRQLKGN